MSDPATFGFRHLTRADLHSRDAAPTFSHILSALSYPTSLAVSPPSLVPSPLPSHLDFASRHASSLTMYLTSRDENANTTAELPVPYQIVPPSGKFDGDDGKWSTFNINVGDRDGTGRGQNFRVLVSTSSSVTQVPMQASWCSDDDCAQDRGIEVYQSRQPKGLVAEASTGWTQNGIYSYATPYWWTGRNINVTWGWSNVGLGSSSPQSPVLTQQMVVGNTNEEFFLGSLGVEILPITTGGGPQATYLDNLAYSNQTASRSYGYTAGASYSKYNLFHAKTLPKQL